MSLYVNTGKAETDRMISSALKMMSPSVGSLAICTPDVQIPADASYVIVICEGDDFLTSAAHSANEEKLEGAYGVLQYPISLPELIRTVRQVTSAKRQAESDFVFDRERRVVSKNGNSVTLSEKEAELFALLLQEGEKPLSRETLRCRLWQNTDGTNAPDVYVSYLRRKLTPILGEGFIINVRGEGYMIRKN